MENRVAIFPLFVAALLGIAAASVFFITHNERPEEIISAGIEKTKVFAGKQKEILKEAFEGKHKKQGIEDKTIRDKSKNKKIKTKAEVSEINEPDFKRTSIKGRNNEIKNILAKRIITADRLEGIAKTEEISDPVKMGVVEEGFFEDSNDMSRSKQNSDLKNIPLEIPEIDREQIPDAVKRILTIRMGINNKLIK